jgi:hypothetical protein
MSLAFPTALLHLQHVFASIFASPEEAANPHERLL